MKLFTGTGTGFMEATIRNSVREMLLICVNGSFRKRFVDVARGCGLHAQWRKGSNSLRDTGQ